MSLRQKIIINAGANWALTFTTAIVGVVLTPILLCNLGESDFGVWALLAYGLSYPMILERAFSLAINRFVAFYHNDIEKLNRFVSVSFAILILLAVLTVAAATVLSFFVSDIFAAIPFHLKDKAQITCIMVGFTLAFKILEATFGGALRGYQYYARSNIIMIAGNFIRLFFTIALLLIWKSMIAVQLVFMVVAIMSFAAMFIVAHKSIAGLCVNLRLINMKAVRELFRYTFHSIARSGSTIVMMNTLTLLVGWKGTAGNVAVYTIASRLPGFVRGFLAGTQNVFLPAITSLWAKGQIDTIKSVMKKGTKISSVLTCIATILLFVFVEEILTLWLRRSVSEEMIWVTRVLIISVVPLGFFGIWFPSLVGMGYLRGLTIAAISSASVAILLELILLQGYVAIPMAPAIALVSVMIIYGGAWLPLYGISRLGMSPYEYFKDSLCQPLIASVFSILVLWLLKSDVFGIHIHWLLVFTLSAVVVMANFAVISLRTETKRVISSIRKKNIIQKEDLS